MAEPVRIGKIGTVDEETGLVSVVYTDRQGETTEEMPMLFPGGIWKRPEIGALVAVNAMSNGSNAAVVLGQITNEFNAPIPASWSCKFGQEKTKDFITYDDETETLTINAKKIVVEAEKVEISGDVKCTGTVKITGKLTNAAGQEAEWHS